MNGNLTKKRKLSCDEIKNGNVEKSKCMEEINNSFKFEDIDFNDDDFEDIINNENINNNFQDPEKKVI